MKTPDAAAAAPGLASICETRIGSGRVADAYHPGIPMDTARRRWRLLSLDSVVAALVGAPYLDYSAFGRRLQAT